MQKFVDSNQFWHTQLFGSPNFSWVHEKKYNLEKTSVEIFFKANTHVPQLMIEKELFENTPSLNLKEAFPGRLS